MDSRNDSSRTTADSLRSDETPAPIRYTRLWIGLVTVIVASFAVLGYYGGEVYRQAPPVPERVVTTDGEVLFTGQDIKDGQNVWQSMGGQEVGTVWGHGAYVAPDWSADWLHREATWLLDHWAQAEHGNSFASLTDEDQAALKARLKNEIRNNTYDPKTGDLVVSPLRARGDPIRRRALHRPVRRRSGGRQAARRLCHPGERDPQPATACGNSTTSSSGPPGRAATNRPGGEITYTNNWPSEALIDNRPSGTDRRLVVDQLRGPAGGHRCPGVVLRHPARQTGRRAMNCRKRTRCWHSGRRPRCRRR